MQFLEIEFLKFGCFTNARLDFGLAGPRLHVIHGPNEAGKSTALRGLTDFLYGIPNRSTDNFQHKNNELRIGARLVDDGGRMLRWIRRKGAKDTLLNAEGKSVDEGPLQALLKGVTRDVFEKEFRLDHPQMVEGGQDLGDGQGDLASSLFQAGAGVLGIRRLLQNLEEEAERLFKPRGSNQELHKAIELWKERQGRKKDATFLASQWKELRQQVEQQARERRQLTTEHAELSTERQRLERYQQALRLVTGYRQKQAALAALPQRRLVPPAAREARARALRDVADAQRQIGEVRLRKDRREQELEKLPESAAVLVHKADIEALQRQLGSYDNAARDLGPLQQELVELQADNRSRLEQLSQPLSEEEAARHKPTRAQQENLDKLIRARTQLDTRLEGFESQRRQLELKVGQLEAEVSASTGLTDPLPLRSLLKRFAAEGNLAAEHDQVERELAQLERRLQGGLSQLQPWTGTPADLEFLPAPASETLDAFDAEYRQLAAQRQQRESELRQRQTEHEEAEQQLRQLAAQGVVPTEADLSAMRDRRDQLWSSLRPLLTGETGAAPEPRGNSRQINEYELAVDEADELADRLRREADRVARQATLQAIRDRLARELDRLRTEHESSLRAEQQLAGRWRDCWASCGFAPRSPAEMRSWLAHLRGLQQLTQQQAEGRAQQAELAIRLGQQRQLLEAELQTLHEVVPPGRSVPQLIEYGTGVAERLEAWHVARATAQQQLRQASADLANLTEAEHQERQKQQEWLREWGEFVQNFPVSTEDPEDLRTMFATLEAVANGVAKQESLRRRIDDIREHLQKVTSEAQRLSQTLAPGLESASPARIAQELNERVARAGRAAGQRSQLEQDLQEDREQLATAETRLQQANAELANLARQAGCASQEELTALEAESEQIESLRQDLDRLRTELSHSAAGQDLEEFITEVSKIDPDLLPVRLAELQQRLQTLDEQRTALSQELGRLEGELQRHTTGSPASEAEQEAREALAAIRPLAEQYARLKLAQGLLRRHLEAYRQKTQDPVLERATALFAQLTNGAFQGIKSDFDEKDRPILKGVRTGGEELEIAGLSAGTRDQLFLALRLASLERQLAAAARVPLIVDDILINFDDQRSKATLAVLAEFARQTQVLFFTHHPRLVELARDAVPSDQLQVLEFHR
ncbi:MAG: AAA family ATPase [Planctomycetaceae bacterium]